MTSSEEPAPGPVYPIIADSTPWRCVSPEERRAAQEHAFSRILESMDPEVHHWVRKYLPGAGLEPGATVSVGGLDPVAHQRQYHEAHAHAKELARLIGVIASIHALETATMVPPPGETDTR